MEVLKCWRGIHTKRRRKIVQDRDQHVESDTFGLVQQTVHPKPKHVSTITTRFPHVAKVVNLLVETEIKNKEFHWTSFTVNRNLQCMRHRDSNNMGESAIIALGM